MRFIIVLYVTCLGSHFVKTRLRGIYNEVRSYFVFFISNTINGTKTNAGVE